MNFVEFEITDLATERFFERAICGATDECWEWSGARNTTGYGTLTVAPRKSVVAHRWSYRYHVGDIPAGFVIDHLCRNRACVNPNHLEAVTQAENARRGDTGVYARLAATVRTHCKWGHEFTPENTYAGRDGRTCITCRRERDRRRRPRGSAA